MTPTLLILAGPNGSGKSTLASTQQFAKILNGIGAEFLNPDELARSAPEGSSRFIWSGREVHQRVVAAVEKRRSIAIETTLSGNNHFRTAENCKSAGYYLALHFVFVSDLALANARVRLRAELGGHDVSLDDQTRRYGRSFRNAVEMIAYCDEAFIYNNDLVDPLVLMAEYRHGKLIYLDHEGALARMRAIPHWLPLQGRLCPFCSSYGPFYGDGPHHCPHCGKKFERPNELC